MRKRPRSAQSPAHDNDVARRREQSCRPAMQGREYVGRELALAGDREGTPRRYRERDERSKGRATRPALITTTA